MRGSDRDFFLDEIKITGQNKVEYIYRCGNNLKKFFNKNNNFYVEYDVNISDVPLSILSIPLLVNVLPVVWFAGNKLYINEVDEDFFFAQKIIRNEFQKLYPELKARDSGIEAVKLIKNHYETAKSAMLFSGGVDSYTTYFRHFEENPDLITVFGADIPLNDIQQQDRFLKLYKDEKILDRNHKLVIRTNLRDFYTYRVNTLVPSLSWWGEIQHGMALTGITAPLAFIRKYHTLYIASTNTKDILIPWGSNPYIDNNIRWGDTTVSHDGFELERIEKISYIVQSSLSLNYKPKLRVCYSEVNKSINCSVCEKCIRSAFGIVLSGDDPNNYGFNISGDFYEKINKIITKPLKERWKRRQWQQLLQIAQKDISKLKLQGIILSDTEIERLLSTKIIEVKEDDSVPFINFKKIKLILRAKFSVSYAFYLKLRRKMQ